MKPQVMIFDDRSPFQKKEDEQFLCQTKCKHFSRCISKCGLKCTQLGGNTIPKMK